MKVLFATCAGWLLAQFGTVTFRLASRLFVWADGIEDWAGIAPNPDDYKVGGTD